MEIYIDSKSFSTTEYYAGSIKTEKGFYKYTLVNNDTGLEVTWIEETPENNEQLEHDIIIYFQTR